MQAVCGSLAIPLPVVHSPSSTPIPSYPSCPSHALFPSHSLVSLSLLCSLVTRLQLCAASVNPERQYFLCISLFVPLFCSAGPGGVARIANPIFVLSPTFADTGLLFSDLARKTQLTDQKARHFHRHDCPAPSPLAYHQIELELRFRVLPTYLSLHLTAWYSCQP